MNRVYTNYFSGPVSQVSDCLEIVLYNKASFSERISLYNLKDFYFRNLIGTSGKFIRIIRESSTILGQQVPFEYKKSLPGGFNVIVYLNRSSDFPIGYTEFVNTQGIGLALGITLHMQRILGEELVISLNNQLVGKDLYRRYQGSEPYNYATQSMVKDKKYRNLFTSDIVRLESDIYSMILGSSGVSTKEGNWRIKVKENITVDTRLTNYNICFYNGSLVLASWNNSTSYKLYSLIGNGSTITGTTLTGIEGIEGRYYWDVNGEFRDLVTGDQIRKTQRTLFCDYLDQHCKVYDLPTLYSRSTVLKYIPEINNMYLDLDNYLKSYPLVIQGKIGQWFILYVDYCGTEMYQAVSPTSVITMTKEDLENAIFVGDQTLILNESGDESHEGYYLIYNSFDTELTTERARAILENGRLDWKFGIYFCYLDTEEDDDHFEEYFGDNGLVSIVLKDEELCNTSLSKYRRNIYPDSVGIPELIGSYGGLLFYKSGSNINYL